MSSTKSKFLRGAANIALSVFVLSLNPAIAQNTFDLIDAVTSGDRSSVSKLLQSGASVDQKNAEGETALLIAVQKNEVKIAEDLMRAGASINAQANNLDTPWLLAGAEGRTEIIRLMIPRGPDLSIRNRFGGNALIPACERGHVDTIALLLTTKIDVNHVNNLGWTCLLEIVILGNGGANHIKATELVLAAGADPNIADKNGMTPLAHALAGKQLEIAALIRKAGGQ